MSDFTRYKNFAVGTFYSIATVIMLGTSFIVYTQWQNVWNEGFSDFKNISTAIVELKDSTKPISDIAPDIHDQMVQMNTIITLMQKDTNNMSQNVWGLNTSVYNMSHSVPLQMDRMQDNMNMFNMFSP